MGILDLFGRDKAHAEAVRHDAAELRRRFGDEAELWCEAGILGAADGATRRLLKEIRKALDDVPGSGLH